VGLAQAKKNKMVLKPRVQAQKTSRSMSFTYRRPYKYRLVQATLSIAHMIVKTRASPTNTIKATNNYNNSKRNKIKNKKTTPLNYRNIYCKANCRRFPISLTKCCPFIFLYH
jgi:hypothetical protein